MSCRKLSSIPMAEVPRSFARNTIAVALQNPDYISGSLNDARTPGWWKFNESNADLPEGFKGFGMLEVVAPSVGTYVYQKIYSLNYTARMAIRSFYVDRWTDWTIIPQ